MSLTAILGGIRLRGYVSLTNYGLTPARHLPLPPSGRAAEIRQIFSANADGSALGASRAIVAEFAVAPGSDGR